ncbi:MAG TPA: Lrp/AsnC family transcriptional regulator [Anaerolineales bacterium]|nr:Lrp/AsnC family transcriptional regulator [Anaerolineales bacterium]HMV97273.1 Lrp/AsnC family transcriptional regulator [Anaerolineales bacterium]HMX73818.1 Lrp/AsnC family transcriptional regulator [Anaerolineales bacterium]HMZ45030.1 Lrp/AsnC family transcriptional regulator [Anaerolineales bacterium]HNA54272.1 Lrp/AsnC family transcriptional regulator [Anaerolineales bacterium]
MESLIGSGNPSSRLDNIDQYIIDAMRKDGREAFAQIAEKLNVSPGMIRQRYNRLVELGYLKVVAVTNPLMMGIRTMALIGIHTDGHKMLQVAEEISKIDEVVYLVVVSGRYDIVCEVFCRDHEDLLKFLTEKLAQVDGIRETESFIHLKIMKEIYF